MKKYAKNLVLSLLVLMGVTMQIASPAEDNPTFSQRELDQMLAPIALYPDPLLAQILMAATYPLEVVRAARWSSANPALKGDAAVRAVDNMNWDTSVKSLVAFPQVLQIMDQKIEWTERLGDAFLAQQSQVMDTVQALRKKAQASGNLSSNSQIQITESNEIIEVVAANPEVVYVPYYDPVVIYGPWWWPDYPPVYWGPWVGYGWYGGFAWGVGIGIGANFYFGSWDWHHHRVRDHDRDRDHQRSDDGAWQHDPHHRHGVPYRDESLNRQFGRAKPGSRTEFRGHEPSLNARSDKPGNRLPTERAQRPHLPETHERVVPARQPLAEPRAHALDNVGRGADVRNFSARGHASLPGRSSAAPRESSHGSSNQGRP